MSSLPYSFISGSIHLRRRSIVSVWPFRVIHRIEKGLHWLRNDSGRLNRNLKLCLILWAVPSGIGPVVGH